MSGIIGVGSKSGIIGSTEIPGGYETGIWEPAGTGINSSNPQRTYVRIGDYVFCIGWCTAVGTNSGAMTGLPFVSRLTGSGKARGCGSVGYQNQDSSETWQTMVSENAATFNFRFNGAVYLVNGEEVHFNLYYCVE